MQEKFDGRDFQGRICKTPQAKQLACYDISLILNFTGLRQNQRIRFVMMQFVRLGMQIATPFIPLIRGTGEYTAKPHLPGKCVSPTLFKITDARGLGWARRQFSLG